MKFSERAVVFLATGFFVGNVPFAPGTFGSLLALPVCFFLSRLRIQVAILCTLLIVIFAILLARTAEKILHKKDPGCIVIDEIAGLVVTLLGLPFNLVSITAGFAVFRALDILKPFPIRALERKLAGGAGIVLDDVVAGLYGNLVLRLAFHVAAIS